MSATAPEPPLRGLDPGTGSLTVLYILVRLLACAWRPCALSFDPTMAVSVNGIVRYPRCTPLRKARRFARPRNSRSHRGEHGHHLHQCPRPRPRGRHESGQPRPRTVSIHLEPQPPLNIACPVIPGGLAYGRKPKSASSQKPSLLRKSLTAGSCRSCRIECATQGCVVTVQVRCHKIGRAHV